MSDCASVRDLMLEAEPASLAGHGDDPVATHLRTCASCAALARTVLAETASLDRFLSATGQVDATALVEAALGPVEPRSTGSSPESAGEPVLRRRIAPAFPRRWAALAAAAAVAGLLFVRGDRPLPVKPIPGPQGPPPLVEAAPGQNVAVLATGNPDITVLWFYP